MDEYVGADIDPNDRWKSVQKMLTRSGPYAVPEEFSKEMPYFDFINNSAAGKAMGLPDFKVLVVGAGGLGCELLKDLALSGFGDIHVIDMDTIDVSNLNRQFLFRPADVGKDKAGVAAAFINKRIEGANVTAHFNKIQDYGADFYKDFKIVVCGLDSILARRWINAMLHSLLVYDKDGNLDPSTSIPLVDGGTEGFKGNSRVIKPGGSGHCIECMLDLYPPQTTYAMCTIAQRPRLPEHCVMYAKLILWPREKKDEPIDGDDPDHIRWLFEQAAERAAEFGIKGVNYRLTQGVVKNIIPAVASTNAVIAASCANEAFKIATSCCAPLNNYMGFNDADGIYTYSLEYEKNPTCQVCCSIPVPLECKGDMTLTALIELLKTDPRYQMKQPALMAQIEGKEKPKSLYQENPAALEKMLRKNLDQTLTELGLANGTLLIVQDPNAPMPFKFYCDFS